MKKYFRTWVLSSVTVVLSLFSAKAQVTDVTSLYLNNTSFDSGFDYTASDVGNVAQEILEVQGWTKEISANYTIAGVYEYGTLKTFNGVSVPESGYNGTSGGGLALSTGWGIQLKYYQDVTLPDGRYALITAFYNSSTVTAGSSLAGWIPAESGSTISSLASFPSQVWVTDTVYFNVIGETKGKIQIGLRSVSGSGSGSTAKVLLDFVQLLSCGIDKTELESSISEALALYGDGSGKGAAALKVAIDSATAVNEKSGVTMTEIARAIKELNAAIRAYELAAASVTNPIDYTYFIKNPSFEEDGFNHWTNSNMQTQTNTSFTLKEGATYVEKWVSNGNLVGSGSVTQSITGLDNGRYILKAVAQNIQQNSPMTVRSGAWIFADDNRTAVGVTKEYSVEFTVIEKQVTIGFKAENATGNYMACDNFRLCFAGNDSVYIKEELQNRIDKAEALRIEKMQVSLLTELTAAVELAKAQLSVLSDEELSSAAIRLREATAAAEISVKAYRELQTEIDDAIVHYGEGTQQGSEDFLVAIQSAQAMVENLEATLDQLSGAITDLSNALFTFRIANATGTVPTVVTYPYVARGAVMALGRSTITGVAVSQLKEHGFCWSTEPEPTVSDNRTTKYFTQQGYIYRIEDLQPATVYYMRAYAITKDYAVGYGKVVKVITIPKGNISYTYNNGGSAEDNERINAALKSAVNYWNDLTSIKGFRVTCSFGSGTPTADCGYGGGMRVGPNASYQRTGTILHEMGHGVGVGTHSIWYGPSSPLRSNGSTGTWLGDRTNKVVQFLDNAPASQLNGDAVHMWPYGINGAHEDSGSELLYIGNSLITQGLGEDGLPPTGGFCTPAYVFEQEDSIKYYIKNESETCGLYTSYLAENAKGQLVWRQMQASEALADDLAAWYVTFNPKNGYYQFRNASTGHYITYSTTGTNGIRTVAKSTVSTNENFHLMRSRMDVAIGSGAEVSKVRGYWIIHPENKLNPACLAAGANGVTATATFNIANTAQTQRWLLLTPEEMQPFEAAAKETFLANLADLIVKIRQLAETPHTEDVSGVDNDLAAKLSDIEARSDEELTLAAVSALIEEAETAGMAFLAEVTPSDINTPFDLTFLVNNAAVDHADGWSVAPAFAYSCAEFYQTTFDFNQTVTGLPAGTYRLKAQAFQRPGRASDVYNSYVAGSNNVSASLYINNKSVKIKNAAADAQSKKLGGAESEVGSAPVKYIPNNMEAASKYFAAGFYDNEIITELNSDGSNLKIGLRNTKTADYYWCIFDNFRLYYYGSMTADVVTGIDRVTPSGVSGDVLFPHPSNVYGINGKLVRRNATSLEGFHRGIYIVNGEKVIVK